MKLGRLIGSLVIAGFVATGASAQSTGGLRVRVIDSADKSAVIGAAVTLSNTNKYVATSTTITDVNGFALFPVLRVGSGYVVQVIMDGYAGIRQETNVSGGTIKDVVIALAPEHVERVTVIGEKSQIDLDNNQAATKFSSDFIQDLPIAGRAYQNVLTLAAGVQDPDGDGNPNVNGSRERDFKTSVGSISNVDPLTGTLLNQVNADSIEDLTVVTSGAGAEFGRAQGGFAQIIQKQGSNDFEGVFGFIYSSSVLDGNGSTNIPNSLVPDFYRYQPSLQVSGPIVKDKLWYRLSEEVVHRVDPVVLATGGSIATQGTDRFSTDNQLTWQVSNRNKLAFNFRADPVTTTNVGVSSLVPADSTEEQKFGGPTYQLTWTAPYSPSLYVNSTVAYQDTSLDITPTATGVVNDCFVPAYLRSAQCFNANSGSVSGSAVRTWSDERQRLTVLSDAQYYANRFWGASHQFKFGLIVENERYFRSLVRTPNFLLFPSLDTNGRVGLSYSVTASLEPDSRQTSNGTTWGIYGEDALRPLANLSITIGLRIEQESINAQGYVPFDPQAESDAFIAATAGLPPEQTPVYLQQAFIGYEDIPGAINAVRAQFPLANIVDGAYTGQLQNWRNFRQQSDINLNNTNFSPRLSISWDPWNDGKTKLSASFGRYFDKIFLAVPAAEAEPVLVTFTARDVPGPIAFEPTFSYSTVSRDLKTPYSDEYALGFEREIWQESSISLRYVHKNIQRQLQDIDINGAPGDYGRCLKPLSTDGDTLVASPGTGTIIDPYTGQAYEDTDPGIGDGRLDDCSGGSETATVPPEDGNDTGNNPTVPRPDGVPDLYVLNPGWGSIFQIGNYNSAKYDGITVEFTRRQYKNWSMLASYTLSKATGNGEDYNLALGDDRSTLQDEAGYQSYDIRHSLKVSATTVVPGGVRLGGIINWQSGLPYSILFRRTSTTATLPDYNFSHNFQSTRTGYPTHQRNDQRNSSAWNFDAQIVKEFNLPKGMNLQLTADIFNLFGENTYAVYNTNTKSGQQINGQNDGFSRFGRQYQVGMRLAF